MTEKQQKLIDLLKEMFQLDQSDLDFGIYRIMNAKSEEISTFLEKDLIGSIKEAFASSAGSSLQQDLATAIEQARALGADPETLPKVQELRAKLSGISGSAALEDEVYSHLASFFSRYYQEGDFISLRRYKKDTYAIPYEGEEVKLHWANSDQYYIKTSEYFRDYAFKVSTADGLIEGEEKTIHFKLIDAETETNNNKASADKERRFVLAENPLEEIDGELIIRFEYKAIGKEKQDALNADAVSKILVASGFENWKTALKTLAPTDKNPKRTVLEKHLTSYTSRNTFDYFIHKDLGGFLSRELDFYIKNEMLYLDDIENATSAKIEESLGRIKTFKIVAQKIIAFLTQLEEFQKSLWLKKKFIIETNYCITLDRIDSKYYTEILANEEQKAEWKKLFSVEVKTLEDLTPYLVLDTKFFSIDFKSKLLSEFDNFDEQIDGILINSDNFSALQLLQERYQNQVKCVYIDPPYNTGNDGFLYKDTYKHSSWMSFIQDRLELCKELLNSNGLVFSSIDDFESTNLIEVMNKIFGENNFLLPLFIQVRFDNKTLSEDSDFHKVIEQILIYAKTDQSKIIKDKEPYSIEKFEWKIIEKTVGTDVIINGKKTKIFKEGEWEVEQVEPSYTGLKETWATGSLARQKGSSGEFFELYLGVRKNLDGLNCLYKVEGIGEDGLGYRYFTGPKKETASKGKFYSGIPLQTLDALKKGSAYKDKPIPSFFNFAGDFGNCRLEGKVDIKGGKKPEKLIQKIINLVSNDGEKDIVLDFFAGSGTTPSVAHKMKKKYIAIEMGEYFDSKVMFRLKHTLNGDNSGIVNFNQGGIFQYLRLESYEDALNNLTFNRSTEQQRTLDSNASVREDYTLNYMLDFESAASRLDITAFSNPFDYTLRIATGSAGETKESKIDLVETFNYLIGIKVKARQMKKGFLTIEGENLKNEKILIIWREGNDNEALNVFFEKMDWSVYDREFDTIYVNGDNNLANLKKDEDHFKVKLIEEEFKNRMFGGVV